MIAAGVDATPCALSSAAQLREGRGMPSPSEDSPPSTRTGRTIRYARPASRRRGRRPVGFFRTVIALVTLGRLASLSWLRLQEPTPAPPTGSARVPVAVVPAP